MNRFDCWWWYDWYDLRPHFQSNKPNQTPPCSTLAAPLGWQSQQWYVIKMILDGTCDGHRVKWTICDVRWFYSVAVRTLCMPKASLCLAWIASVSVKQFQTCCVGWTFLNVILHVSTTQADFLGAAEKTNINRTLALFGHWPDRLSQVVNPVLYALAALKWIALVRSRMLAFSLVILLLRVAIMETLQRTRTEVGFLGSSFSIACISLEDGTDYEPFYVVGEHVNKASLGSVSSKPDSHRTHMVSWRSHQGLMTVSWDSANLSDWETLALYHSTGVM